MVVAVRLIVLHGRLLPPLIETFLHSFNLAVLGHRLGLKVATDFALDCGIGLWVIGRSVGPHMDDGAVKDLSFLVVFDLLPVGTILVENHDVVLVLVVKDM